MVSVLSALCTLIVSTSNLTVEPVAFTYHGYIKEAELQQIRRDGDNIDESGRTTFHSAFGLTYRRDYFELTGIYFKNSFNDDSGAMMAGPSFYLGPYLNLGVVGGGYARKQIKGYSLPMSYKNGTVELAPMVMATGALSVKLYRNISFELNAGSNYILNFFMPGLRIKL